MNPQQLQADQNSEQVQVTRQNQEDQNTLCVTVEEFHSSEREATVSERHAAETEERSNMCEREQDQREIDELTGEVVSEDQTEGGNKWKDL